jgi:uncharacterized protein (DUF849 family)
MSRSILIYAALTGSRYTREPNQYAPYGVPEIPYTYEEAFSDAEKCYQQGARLIHVHSRGCKGEHLVDSDWYHNFVRCIRNSYSDIRLCLATSRAGEVAQEIKKHYVDLLEKGMGKEEAALHAEFRRVAYLNKLGNTMLPDYVTAFTATEVKMLNNELETGHVNDITSKKTTRQFFKALIKETNEKNVKQEIEITTQDSLELLEKEEHNVTWGKEPSIVFLPGFTRSFPFSIKTLDSMIARAREWLDQRGGGLISLGRILSYNENTDFSRHEHIRYTVQNPHIDAIRIGIEDGPFWGERTLSNSQLVQKTYELIKEYGGDISQ